jgi:hypothetical protein
MIEQMQKGGSVVIEQFEMKKDKIKDVLAWSKTLTPEEMQKEENINAFKNYIVWSKQELDFLYDNYTKILEATIKVSKKL